MKKFFIILTIVVIILIVIGWFFRGKIFISPEEKYNQEVIKTMTASNCTMLPGDPPRYFGAVNEDDKNFTDMKKICEMVPNCALQQQGCGMRPLSMGGGYGSCQFTCCPKDLYIEDKSNPYHESILNPKYEEIMRKDKNNPISACFLIIN